MIYAGIDAGSRATKIVLFDNESQEIVAKGIRSQNVHADEVVQALYKELLGEAGISDGDVKGCIATGYSRHMISRADSTITEITCHGCGVHHLVPEARTIVEIGGQDSKVLHLSENGSVFDFSMNDRCAAGTGRFLEVVADRLHVGLADLGPLAAKSEKPSVISSMCIVFAETEIIGLLAAGAEPENIVAGVQNAVTTRVASMLGRNIVTPIVFTGGVAMISGMDRALAHATKKEIQVCPNAQLTGALGAAIMASRQGI